MEFEWECWHGCGRTCSSEFYQEMIKRAGHPPLCVCRAGDFNKSPWSLWRKVPAEPPTAEEEIGQTRQSTIE